MKFVGLFDNGGCCIDWFDTVKEAQQAAENVHNGEDEFHIYTRLASGQRSGITWKNERSAAAHYAEAAKVSTEVVKEEPKKEVDGNPIVHDTAEKKGRAGKWSQREVDAMVDAYTKGKSINYIAGQLKRSYNSVWYKLNGMGLLK